MHVLKKTGDAIGLMTRAVSSVCLFAVFLLFLLNICTRIPFITWNPTWIDEVIQFFLVWMIFLGAAELVRTGGHFMVDILTDKLHGTLPGRVFRLISTILLFVTYAVILYFGWSLCVKLGGKVTYTLPSFITMKWFYACIPVSALLMVVYSVRDVVLAVMDIVTGGKITERQDAEKAAAALEDDDARAIAEAAAALKADEEAPRKTDGKEEPDERL